MGSSPAIFFDIGGVLLTDGWDRNQRKIVYQKFGLDITASENKHEILGHDLNTGRISFDDYLLKSVFDSPREFTKEQFLTAIYEQSQPIPEMISLAIKLAERNRLYTLNNESNELHRYRVEKYKLDQIFSDFFCSGFMGHSKPGEIIFRNALEILSLKASEVIFVDDREENIKTARNIGMLTIHHKNTQQTVEEFKSFRLL